MYSHEVNNPGMTTMQELHISHDIQCYMIFKWIQHKHSFSSTMLLGSCSRKLVTSPQSILLVIHPLVCLLISPTGRCALTYVYLISCKMVVTCCQAALSTLQSLASFHCLMFLWQQILTYVTDGLIGQHTGIRWHFNSSAKWSSSL
jgi:hypothetical protein